MKSLLLGALLLAPLSLYAQNFEGIIKFNLEYEITDSRIIGTDLNKELGREITSYYNKTKKLDRYNTGVTELFNSSETTSRIREPNGSNLIINVATDSVSIIKISDIPTNEVILGCPLKAILVQYSDSTSTELHYCEALKVSPSFFKNYKLSGYDQIISRIKSIPLKTYRKSILYNTTYTAVDKKEMKLDKTIFNYPKDLEWEISPDF